MFTVIIEWFELSPPTNLAANGDSRGFTSGRSKVYRVAARSVLGELRSAWSEPVFTYPTTAPLLVSRAVATLRFAGYWDPPQYDYKICSDLIPTTTFDWKTEIRKGIAKWQKATHSMVTVDGTVGDCSGDVTGTDLDGNQIRILPDVIVGNQCGDLDAGACVMSSVSGGELGQAIMLLSADLATHPNSMCSAVLNGAVHEGGHALGFRKHTVVPISNGSTFV